LGECQHELVDALLDGHLRVLDDQLSVQRSLVRRVDAGEVLDLALGHLHDTKGGEAWSGQIGQVEDREEGRRGGSPRRSVTSRRLVQGREGGMGGKT
jgi:hypothetical protein